jgi:hypothetical protein
MAKTQHFDRQSLSQALLILTGCDTNFEQDGVKHAGKQHQASHNRKIRPIC